MNYCVTCGFDLQPIFAAEQYLQGKISRRKINILSQLEPK